MFILKWLLMLFAVTLIIAMLFIEHKYSFIIGLTVGTFLSGFRFLLNVFNFNKIFTIKSKSNSIYMIIFNLFLTVVYFWIIYALFSRLEVIDIYLAIGIFIGISYIPMIIVLEGILQSLYVIRNRY